MTKQRFSDLLTLKAEANLGPRDFVVTESLEGIDALKAIKAAERALGVLVLDDVHDAQVASAQSAGFHLLRSRADLRDWFFPVVSFFKASAKTTRAQPKTSPSWPSLMHDLRRYATWTGAESERQAQKTLDALVRDFPDRRALAEASLAQGRAVRTAVKEALKGARGRGGIARLRRALTNQADHTWASHDGTNKHLRRLYSWAIEKQLNYLDRAAQRPPSDTSSVKASGASHRIDQLNPASCWTLVVDETGANFEKTGGEGRRGRLVGVLLNDSMIHSLPKCPGFHGCDVSGAEVDRVLQALLDQPSGVIGLTVREVPHSGEASLWQTGILELIEWVLRLMPVEGPTRLKVLVEQRASHQDGESWADAIAEMGRQLVKRNLPYADAIKLSVDVVSKDGHSALPYADAVAFTWGSAKAQSRARLKQSGLQAGCLLSKGTLELAARWDAVVSGQGLSAHAWTALLLEAHDDTLERALLQRLTVRARTDDAVWALYLDHTIAHLESKAVNLRALVRQIEWLSDTRPETPLSGRMWLMWQTGRLASINHLGQLAAPIADELGLAAARMVDEDAPLACLADLHRCVSATNAYDFNTAQAALVPWLERPIATPGLQMWGRVQSSLGQLHAFNGAHAEARACFQRALDAFGRLSDAALGAAESGQTNAYLAIATMDDPSASDHAAQAALHRYLGLEDFAAIAKINDKYRQHIAARYLVNRGTPAERDAYLEALGDVPEQLMGHPWPLVLAYQAMLLRDAKQIHRANARMKAAVRLALEDHAGPVVALIGLSLEAVGRRWGLKVISDTQRAEVRGWIEALLPLATDRMKALDDPTHATSDLSLLVAVLPFNFR